MNINKMKVAVIKWCETQTVNLWTISHRLSGNSVDFYICLARELNMMIDLVSEIPCTKRAWTASNWIQVVTEQISGLLLYTPAPVVVNSDSGAIGRAAIRAIVFISRIHTLQLVVGSGMWVPGMPKLIPHCHCRCGVYMRLYPCWREGRGAVRWDAAG